MARLLSILLLAACCLSARATEYFLTLDGSGSDANDGLSPATPLATMSKAMSKGPSNIVTLLPGTHSNTLFITQPGTTLRGQYGWSSIVVGTLNHGVYIDNVDYCTVSNLQVAYCMNSGVKFSSTTDPNGHWGTARGLWIHDCGAGPYNPPEDGRWYGSGIEAHNRHDMLIENCLIERNGKWIRHDHGLYTSGTNILIRRCVFRENLAFAVQCYENPPYECDNIVIDQCVAYNNGRGIYFQAWTPSKRLKLLNSLVVSTNTASDGKPVLARQACTVEVYNSILYTLGNSASIGTDGVYPSLTFIEDYNIGGGGGLTNSHDYIAAFNPAWFVNTTNGLYWPTAISPARNRADSSRKPASDWWGRPVTNWSDIGPWQYSASLATDTRVLYPSDPVAGAPYWDLPAELAIYYASPAGVMGGSGTIDLPWNIGFAVSNAPANSKVVMLPGVYTWNYNITVRTPGLQIVSPTKWAAVISNVPNYHPFYVNTPGSGVVFDGLAFKNNQFDLAVDWDEGLSNCVVRNCWFTGTGNNWPPSQGASGVEIRGRNMTVENCLSEWNGTNNLGYNQGIYAGGEGGTYRNNVCRYNGGAGIILNGHGVLRSDGGRVYDDQNLLYNNVLYGNFSLGSQLSVKADAQGYAGTNTIFGNVIIDPVHSYSAFFAPYTTNFFTNNIVLAVGGSAWGIYTNPLAKVYADYNAALAPLKWAGPHDQVVASIGFANTNAGQFWLRADSPLRGKALASAYGLVDFFGRAQSSVSDIGAFQYDALWAADQRVLDPSPAGGADYWQDLNPIVLPPIGPALGSGLIGNGRIIGLGARMLGGG